MKKYGKSLVNAVPDEATKLLKVLCTDYKPQRSPHEREFTVQSLTSLFLRLIAFTWNPLMLFCIAL